MRYKTHVAGGLLAGVSSFNLIADKLNISSDITSYEGMVFITERYRFIVSRYRP